MNVGLLGAGHIAVSLARGWQRAGARGPHLLFYDVLPGKAAEVAMRFDARAVGSVQVLVQGSDLVVVAVRPADVPALLGEVAPQLGERPLVSVAAGVTMQSIRQALGAQAAAGRVMPNIAAALGQGTFLFVAGTLGAHAETVREVFGLCGCVVDVGEEVYDVATAVSGCMPGFMAAFLEAMEQAGVEHGLEAPLARQLVLAAARGAVALISEAGETAAVRASVATPGGMTAAGLAALERLEAEEEAGMRVAVRDAVAAAVQRAQELGS